MRHLSLGKQTYKKLVEQDLIYVDKTKIILKMITEGAEYFLSRPRRFGKSLTISTLKEIFKGSKDLFKNTYIYNSNYDWIEYPIIHFDLSKYDSCNSVEELKQTLFKNIRTHAKQYNIELEEKTVQLQFDELIEKMAEKGKVVILIDEYDNPIISNIDDIDKAKNIQAILKGFYKIIKSQDENIRFVFITGITKFSQVSIFSALNNLTDLTMNDNYAALCGYTENEIKFNFKEYTAKWAKQLECSEDYIFNEIQKWYNGFKFSKTGVKVYNPWSTLSFFNTGEFENYWFQTGTPTFLIKLVKDKNFDIASIENFQTGSNSFSTFEIEKLRVLPLLFQTGYLTIKDYNDQLNYYTLNYPNREVKQSFIEILLDSISRTETDNILIKLSNALSENDLDTFFEYMDILLSKIDYDLHLKDEKYWQSLFYMILTLLGYKVFAEFKTIKGRIDAVIETETYIYIVEFKTTGSKEIALDQIKNREYYKRFKDSSKKIILIGSKFEIRNKTKPTIQTIKAYGFETSPLIIFRIVVYITGITNRSITANFPNRLNSFSVKALLFHIDIVFIPYSLFHNG